MPAPTQADSLHPVVPSPLEQLRIRILSVIKAVRKATYRLLASFKVKSGALHMDSEL